MLSRRVTQWEFLPWGDELNEEFWSIRRSPKDAPENWLCGAILKRALLDAGVIGDIRDHMGGEVVDLDYYAAEARRWILSDDDRPFGFLFCIKNTISDETAAKDVIEFARAAALAKRRQINAANSTR